nr:response regulator [Marinobacter halodurans]
MANILAVDDAASIRQMVAFALKGAGHAVTEAADGKQALELARQRGFDLVLTDVNMPVMDGLALTRELRKLAGFRFTPILVLTTEAGPDKNRKGVPPAPQAGW